MTEFDKISQKLFFLSGKAPYSLVNTPFSKDKSDPAYRAFGPYTLYWPADNINPPPSFEDVSSISDEMLDRILYADRRREEYGSIEDQLDFIVKNGVEAYRERNLAIKAKYPKPK